MTEPNENHTAAVESTDLVALNVAEVTELIETLWAARCDIWQSARVSEYNLTGVDPCFPRDRPQIPETPQLVHRQGLDQSYSVMKQVEATMQMLTAKRNTACQERATVEVTHGTNNESESNGN